MRWVLCLVLLILLLWYYYYCFRLVTKLAASHGMCKTKSGCHFKFPDGNFIRKLPPFFCGRSIQKRYPKVEAWKITTFGSIREPNRICDPNASIFGSRNGVIRYYGVIARTSQGWRLFKLEDFWLDFRVDESRPSRVWIFGVHIFLHFIHQQNHVIMF